MFIYASRDLYTNVCNGWFVEFDMNHLPQLTYSSHSDKNEATICWNQARSLTSIQPRSFQNRIFAFLQ